MAYADYQAELLGHVAELGILAAGRLVNRAWRDIREARLWSWLTSEGVFVTPPLISTGLVTTTQYSTTVSLSASANAALNNLTNPLVTQRQFRAGPVNGGIYNIASYNNSAATITLDRIYQEPGATTSYQVYRCYYAPCDASGNTVTDFLTFIAMKNPDYGYRISRSHLHHHYVEIDNMDPLRADQGLAYYVATYKFNTALNIQMYELWPHPVYASGYTYLYRRRGLPMVLPTDDIPSTVSSDMLIERSLYYVAQWADKNKGRYPQLRGVDWRADALEHTANYKYLLQEAKRQDDELFNLNFIPSQWSDDLMLDEDLQVSTLLSVQSDRGWQGG